jgi:hypothetical protein
VTKIFSNKHANEKSAHWSCARVAMKLKTKNHKRAHMAVCDFAEPLGCSHTPPALPFNNEMLIL